MCNDKSLCRAWISLEQFGINAKGCLRDSTWLNAIKIPCNQSIFNQSIYIDLPNLKINSIRNVAHGTFGSIDLATYDSENRHCEVYVKRPITAGKSLLYEACIQKLVNEELKSIGFPTGAPDVLSIFKLKDNSICFAMESTLHAITLDRYLENAPLNNVSSIIIDCLLQLCAMIWHLDNKLCINHRDLKPSNFLIVEHNKPVTKVINIENEIIEIESRYSLTFIDFGFSCLGSNDTHIADISLGVIYSKSDPCPKEGRDMYLFLAFIYIDYYHKLPKKLIELFESWLNINTSNLRTFMRKDKTCSKNWLYFIIGNEKIKKFNCCPYKILQDLQAFIM